MDGIRKRNGSGDYATTRGKEMDIMKGMMIMRQGGVGDQDRINT